MSLLRASENRLSACEAQANGRKPAGHGEAHSSTGERDARRASGGRGRQGDEQGQGGAGATAGARLKMSDEPVAREREPIERGRGRPEALVRANAAPRCGARSKRTGKPCRAAAMPNGRCRMSGLSVWRRKQQQSFVIYGGVWAS